MKNENLEFLEEIIDNSNWLFYGDLEEYFDLFLKEVFANSLIDVGFNKVIKSKEFMLAYWLLISEFNKLKLINYGTSPQGAFLTEKGEKFKKIILENDNAIIQTLAYMHDKHIYRCESYRFTK